MTMEMGNAVIGSSITITSDLITAVAKLVEGKSTSVTIEWDDKEPEELWYVEFLYEKEGAYMRYVVNDVTGEAWKENAEPYKNTL